MTGALCPAKGFVEGIYRRWFMGALRDSWFLLGVNLVVGTLVGDHRVSDAGLTTLLAMI